MPGTNDDLEGTYGIVRSVKSGDVVEAWVKLPPEVQRAHHVADDAVLMECMYPKEVKASELVHAILQWEM